jgi:hypothetical protein
MRSVVVLATMFLQLAGPASRLAAQNRAVPQQARDPDFASMRAGTPWYHRVLSAMGGAAIGAGVGFFASQVVHGDWDDRPGASTVARPVWAAVGGSLGFAFGLSFPVGGRGVKAEPTAGLPGGRKALNASELTRTGVNNAYEAIRLRRPEWLIERGTHIIGESPNETIEVYVDDVRLGGIDTLREVDANTIHSMHFFDAGAATLRWGSGHSHGVILVIVEGGRTGGT